MAKKKNFNLIANQLVAIVDFVKWTSSFGAGAIQQMEVPLSGIKLSPEMNRLFALARDDIGWMLVMHEREGAWLENLPIANVFLEFNDGLLIQTEEVMISDEPFAPIGIDIFVPHIEMREELKSHTLLGFGLKRERSDTIERVNRLVPLYTKARYQSLRLTNIKRSTNLFSQH